MVDLTSKTPSPISRWKCRSPTAQIVDGDALVLFLIQTIGEGSRGRLVNDAQHGQAGDLAGIFGGLALAVIEIRGDRDNGFRDRLPEIVFGSLFHLLQNHGRDFGWAVPLAPDFDVGISIGSGHDFVRQSLDGFADLRRFEFASNQPLNRNRSYFPDW